METELLIRRRRRVGGGAPPPPAPDPTLIGAPFTATDITAGNSWTFSGLTFPGGITVLAVMAQGAASTAIGTVTINGVVATLRHAAPISPTNNLVHFYDADVPAGVGSVVIQWTGGTGSRCGIGVWDSGGRGFVSAVSNALPTDDPMVISQNTDAGDAVFLCAWDNQAGTTFSFTGATIQFDNYVETTHRFAGAMKFPAAGGAPEVFEANSSAGAGNSAISVVYRDSN